MDSQDRYRNRCAVRRRRQGIASIEDPVVIQKFLDHLEQRANSTQPLPHPVRTWRLHWIDIEFNTDAGKR